ncbi:MAG: S-layer homology domain-containing protein [Ruminococcaceae bacterium]|nr:S-layer homology domain-containing protein [Oscillospiraceae bacterium]
MKKRIVSLLLCCAMLLSLAPFGAAAETVRVSYSKIDPYIYSGGIFDAEVYVSSSSPNISYQWQADAAFGDGHWLDLEDNQRWKGTQTAHLQLLTEPNNGNTLGSGWEDIPYRCLVTVDGKHYPTQPCHINILPLEQLFDDMERSGQGNFRAFFDDVTVTASSSTPFSCEAGESFSFRLEDIGGGSDANTYLEESEVVFVPEIIVTEGTEVTRYRGEGTYMPRTIGKNTVQVQFVLRMEIGGNKIEEAITEQTNYVSVVAPNAIGSAQTRYEFSLLEYPYNQSKKLITVPKNDGVILLAPAGSSWWLVSYKNTIGYAATSALVINQFIGSVDVRLEAPVAGNVADSTVEITDTTYTQHSVDWYDKTAGSFLDPGDRFIAGHTYSATIWLEVADGCQFTTDLSGNPTVIGKLNGEVVGVHRPYEQDPSYVIELVKTYAPLASTHTCHRVLIPKVEPTCTESGRAAYYRCECGKIYLNATGGSPVSLSSVAIIPATGHTESDWVVSEYKHYKKCTDCGIQIAGTEGQHSGGSATVNEGPICVVCGTEYGSPNAHTHNFVPKQSEYMHWDECTSCGVMDQMELHTFVNGVCTECGAKEVTYDDVFFTDVSKTAYYYDAVMWAVEEGITTGTSATTFSPNATCSRAQAVTFLWRATGSPEPSVFAKAFADVPAGAYYEKAVKWAVGSDITNGTSATTFSPNLDCSRGQIVTLLWRMFGCPEVSGNNPFTDVPANAYYYDAVMWAVERGITNGTSATTFSPNAVCSRGQIVTFLYRAISGN